MDLRNLNFEEDFEYLSEEEIQHVLNNADDVNCLDTTGDSILLFACKQLNVNLVEHVLRKKPFINFINESGESPLHTVINRVETDEESALKIANQLISSGADIELRAYMDKTPFLQACCRNSLAMIKFLVECGCDVSATVEDNEESINGAMFSDIFQLEGEIREFLRTLIKNESHSQRKSKGSPIRK